MDSIQEISNEIITKLEGLWEAAILMLPNFLMAVIVVVCFVLLAKLIRKGTRKLLRKVSDNIAISNLLGTIIYVSIISVGTFFALGILDLDKTVTSLLAGVGVIGLALGFAFQNTAANFISGVMMASEFPLNVGDLVESNGHFGKVQKIGLRYTTMRSFQGQLIVIPNKDILENALTNYTVTGERRVDLECGVSYGDDLELVQKTAVKAIEEMKVSTQPVELVYTGFGDSSINFQLRFWLADAEHADYLKAQSESIKVLKKAFDKEGINIPFPIRTLEFNSNQLDKLTSAPDAGKENSGT